MGSRLTAPCALLLAVLCAPVRAQLPEGFHVDDGFTWFGVETVADVKDGKPFAKGWLLRGMFRVFGPAPKRSAFRMVVTKDGQPVTSTRSEAWTPVLATDPPQAAHDNLIDRTLINTGEGPFEVQMYYIDGDTDQEYLARTCRIVVRKVTRVRGSANNPEADSPECYLSRHGEAVSAWAWPRPSGAYTYTGSEGIERSDSALELTFNLCPSEAGRSLSRGYARISVDGERLRLEDDTVHIANLNRREYRVVHTDRDAAEFRQANPYSEEIGFRQCVMRLPVTFGPVGDFGRANGQIAMNEHPGRWEVQVLSNGELLRTFRFTVAPDGTLAAHPEEAAAGLGFLPGGHLVEVEIPAGGASIDDRLVPAEVAEGGFYGLGWKSPEAQAMAAACPAKGHPWPQSSKR